jgi:hypothetical protein
MRKSLVLLALFLSIIFWIASKLLPEDAAYTYTIVIVNDSPFTLFLKEKATCRLGTAPPMSIAPGQTINCTCQSEVTSPKPIFRLCYSLEFGTLTRKQVGNWTIKIEPNDFWPWSSGVKIQTNSHQKSLLGDLSGTSFEPVLMLEYEKNAVVADWNRRQENPSTLSRPEICFQLRITGLVQTGAMLLGGTPYPFDSVLKNVKDCLFREPEYFDKSLVMDWHPASNFNSLGWAIGDLQNYPLPLTIYMVDQVMHEHGFRNTNCSATDLDERPNLAVFCHEDSDGNCIFTQERLIYTHLAVRHQGRWSSKFGVDGPLLTYDDLKQIQHCRCRSSCGNVNRCYH